jgi:hypothetical protein
MVKERTGRVLREPQVNSTMQIDVPPGHVLPLTTSHIILLKSVESKSQRVG